MDLTTETSQREEFKNILFKLAKSQDVLKNKTDRVNMYRRLEELYDHPAAEKGFRHFYSDIFVVLTELKKDPDLGDMNILGQNLEMIRNGYKGNQNRASDGHGINIEDSINKLYDHVNLDIARILYSDAGDWKLSGEASINAIQTQVTEVADKIEKVQKQAEDKIANQQKEYISILGIFAAVVLAFTGGIAFSTSVLNNIAQASAYRTIFITLMIGLVLTNVLFGLFYYIHLIVSKEEKIKPLIISNVIFIICIIIVFLSWNSGLIESRNNRLNVTNNNVNKQTISVSENEYE